MIWDAVQIVSLCAGWWAAGWQFGFDAGTKTKGEFL